MDGTRQKMAKTVLIVDDIEFVRKTLSDILTAARYTGVGEAADGQEAIEMYRDDGCGHAQNERH